ncbi:MAG: hypothetical protein KF886_13255, partial [Candidatus Hydrogenedentes bacterium]|nr:hypothetical protein [Candidatus Hydrogenedentota bacterium]
GRLCDSHIVPEFFYKQMNLYDEKHRFNVLSTEPDEHRPTEQKGIREKLLCKHCEQKLSVWENHARRVLYGGECIEIAIQDSRGFECTVDYAKFKLFQLSILWRIGISNHSGFSSVNLGDHEIALRRMLHDETPCDTEAYGCVILYSTKHTGITANMIHCMGMSNVDGVECVQLLLGGFFWLFFLSETAIDPRQKELFLQGSGHLRILKIDEDPNQYIESLALDLHRSNRHRFDKLNEDN